MLRSLMDKDGQCKQRDGKSEKKHRRNARDKKKTLTQVMNAFDGLISELEKAEERISVLEDTLTEEHREQRLENRDCVSKDLEGMGTVTRGVMWVMGRPGEEKHRKEKRKSLRQ